MSETGKIFFDNHFAWMSGVQAAVTIGNSATIFEKLDADPKKFGKIGNVQYRGVVPWGENNDLPNQILKKIEVSELVSANVFFNTLVAYGHGIEYGEIVKDEKGMVSLKAVVNKEIDEFFENNDILGYLFEQFTDIQTFFNSYCELIFNTDQDGRRKVVAIQSKQTCFSRLEEMNPKTGIIEHHFYSSKWDDNASEKDIIATPMLNNFDTLRDAMIRAGKMPNAKGVKKDLKEPSYIISLNIPAPGRVYYSRPNWWAIFESGWYDFAIAIPTFKKYMMKNQASIKYHIQLDANYFNDIFLEENIDTDAKKKARMQKEFKAFNDFLSNPENTNKSVISYIKYSVDGKEQPKVKITVIDNPKVGGEYIEDSEEASNIISYAMGIHQSLFGTSPNKNKTINGTEARELFIIKQALQKAIRDRVLKPFYIIKKLNGWPDNIGFAISNLELTTLDKGTGSEKKIS